MILIRYGLHIVLVLLIILTLKAWVGSRTSDSPVVEKTIINSPSTKVIKKLETIDQIFTNKKDNLLDLPREKLVTLIVTGDIIPARTVNFQTTSRNNYIWPYEKVADVIKSGDITFANLEAPQIKNCPVTREGMVFCGSDKNIEGLSFAGIDIISLANNHAGNHGSVGVLETTKLLREANIEVTGIDPPAGGVVVLENKGIKFGFLGYNDISSPQPGVTDAEEDVIKREIAEAKKVADVVIVTFHWGVEYRNQPDERQIYLGRLAIDSGADLVIGNHPHWIQPVEFYQGKLITYAHGNFIFDQEWSQKTKEGVVGKYTFFGQDLIDVEYLPVEIVQFGQPYFLEDEKKQRIINEMYQESLILSENSSN